MSYTISIPENSAFTGDHMGLTFTHGKAHTDDYFLASRLQSKGYTVTADKGRESRNTPDTASYIPYIKFYKKPSACRRRISEAFPLRSSPLLLRSDRLF